MKRVCIYCASSEQIDRHYFQATEELAQRLVKEKVEIVFGGGASGLMGKLADTILENDGKIKGIMPEFMRQVEWAHKGVTDFEFTSTLHERKARLIQDTDGLVALPGGCGTLEELLEAITLKRLGLYTGPIVILNTRGFYKPLKEMLETCVAEKYMHERHLQIWTFVDEPDAVIEALKNPPAWSSEAIKFAALT